MNYQAAIEVSELADNLHHSGLVILDCRYDLADPQAGHRAYVEQHIPGARYASLHGDLSGPLGRYGGRHPLPSAEQFQQFARATGISTNSQVVVYDDQRLAFAARAWWLLRYFGHDRVAVLNGGLSAWRRAGLALASGEPNPVPAGNLECAEHREWLIHHDEIYPSLDNPPWQLIDARDARRFAGIEEPIDPVAGHIPTAINKPWQQITNDDGLLKSPREMREHWQDIPGDDRPVCYCGSGVTACVNLLSLYMIVRRDALLYPGSWSDWCAHIVDPMSSDRVSTTSDT